MRLAVIALIALASVPFLLLLSGRRVLISETKVHPGETYAVEGYGNVGAATQASLVCRYFTGRSFQTSVFWYSPNGILGRDSCPFIYYDP